MKDKKYLRKKFKPKKCNIPKRKIKPFLSQTVSNVSL